MVGLPATLTTSSEDYLQNPTTKYVDSLTENIENRFSESLPILTAFQIFDPMGVPARSDDAFKEYGIPQIKILADHFYEEKKVKELTEELECEWKKFKYNFPSIFLIPQKQEFNYPGSDRMGTSTHVILTINVPALHAPPSLHR
ncbi:Hypothetical predicted protein [Paramuricea clavata]|uniref:Uncharacterized protein n=1 Tax=Paramuricea clavata TaxID=317549 RepID=A0A7D9DCI8_PARCT|nr:Hypothetical predicted protein [Paramuricea clavata]